MAKKLNEADLVNSTHKERLAQRDSEPTHLNGGSWDDLGGATIDSEPNSVKIDAGKGVKGQDKSIIGAGQQSEKSHLKTVGEAEGDVDVDFDGDDPDADDIDKELDQFEDVEPVDVDVDMDDDDKDKKVVKESENFDLGGGSEAGENDGKMKSNAQAADAAMQSGPNKETGTNEDELPPWLKKKDGEEDDKEVDEGVDNFGGKKAKPFGKKGVNEDEIIIKKGEGDDDEKKDEKKDDDGGEKKENPFAKKDDDKKEVSESVKIHIRRPDVKLLESAGIPAGSQKKVALVFESVVKDVTRQVATQMHAHYKKLHESKLAKYNALMAKQMDQYLGYVVEEWVKTNRVPIRTALKSQLAEEFLNGFQRLMKEHYISVPDSKVDVVKTLSGQVAQLKKSLTEQTAQKMKLRRIAEHANKARIVAQYTKGTKLSEAQSDKLVKLAEDVAYTTAKEFREKLGMLTESYFGVKQPITKVAGTEGGKTLTEEKITVVKDGKTIAGDPDVALIAETLARQAKSAQY